MLPLGSELPVSFPGYGDPLNVTSITIRIDATQGQFATFRAPDFSDNGLKVIIETHFLF
jgi:hypothetical protein